MRIKPILFTLCVTLALAAAASLPFYFGWRHSQSQSNFSPGVTPPTVLTTFVPPISIRGVSAVGDSAAAILFQPTNPKQTTAFILRCLKSASVLPHVKMPVFHGTFSSAGHLGPSSLSFTDSSGSAITITPAYYFVMQGENLQIHYFSGVLAYNRDETVTYLHQDILYAWLKNDLWKQTFVAPGWTVTTKNSSKS